jgi:hypothetical protein
MAGFLKRLFGAPRITAPVLGVLDLSSGRAAGLAAGDCDALGPLFDRVVKSEGQPIACDVLFLYCSLDSDGSIIGSSIGGLREVIRDSGAKVVVVASPNSAESYIAAAKPKKYGSANLVMTLDRKGDLFQSFHRKLFSAMKRGTSMPVAWVELAPQAPNLEHEDCPDAIFACEIGQLALG